MMVTMNLDLASYVLVAVALLLGQPPHRLASSIVDDSDKLTAELRARPETIRVPCGGSVQAAVRAAKPGDTILLVPQCRYVGQVVLGAKSGVVTITSSTAPDRRVTPADAPLLPILASGGPMAAIDGTGAKNWRLEGVQLESRADGLGEVVVLQDAMTVTLDRVLIVGGEKGQKRAIRGNGESITLTRSYIANIWAPGQDSQAFCAWDGAGPYTITDNYLEAASENVMIGGADSQSIDRIPSDGLIQGNDITKPIEWKGTRGKAVKNLLEFKSAKRWRVTGNRFSNSWTDAQNGYALLVKSVNQNRKAPWSASEDITIEGNTVTGVENGFNLQGYAADQPGGHTTRVTIRGNDVTCSGVAVQAVSELGDVTIERNTFQNGSTFLQLDAATYAMANLLLQNNRANHNAYGIKGSGAGIGLPSLTRFVKAFTMRQNVLLGGAGKGSYPAETWFDLASVPASIVVGR
jgi:hypothetical protein